MTSVMDFMVNNIEEVNSSVKSSNQDRSIEVGQSSWQIGQSRSINRNQLIKIGQLRSVNQV